MSTFREFTQDYCFWCRGPLHGRGLVVSFREVGVKTCVECAVDAGHKMHEAGLERRNAIETAAFGHVRS